MPGYDVTRRGFLHRTGAISAGAALASLAGRQTASASTAASATPLLQAPGPYVATRESLAAHTAPQWFRDAKFGIFIHWGVYAVPAWGVDVAYHGAEWYSYAMHISAPDQTYQHHLQTYGADFDYDRFIPRFRAERYDARAWIELIERAGARYFVLTSKHHDGFQLFPNSASDRNSVVMGPRRDLVGELFHAARTSHLKRGIYHSLGEFFNPALQTPPWNPYTKAPIPYVGYKPVQNYVDEYLHVMLRTLVEAYDPDLLWADGEHWHADLGAGPAFKPKDMDWRGDEILAYYYNQATTRPHPKEVLVNDRFEASHRDYATLEGDKSSYALRADKWEACLTLGRSWGYDTNEDPASIKSSPQIVRLLVDIVSKNGNLLLNIGPKADGTIAPWQSERLLAVGAWLDRNGSAIYDTVPWSRAADGDLRYTVSDRSFNVLGLNWPGALLTVPADLPVDAHSQIRLLGAEGHKIPFRRTGSGVDIELPDRNPNGDDYPFVLRITNS
ncbi:alpha-L-fucosidase [Streptomyces carpinensis]|uniref:alpha-L-fucosidase n=1 Tax=Streptomyces carpinensis TaxID=66369 RepID=A0ABV1WAI7_9ACTN|nr:alpha-L-fucosidase [Streptomyces carpinensis]